MKPHISGITLGVEDVDRARRFYAEGLGWPVGQDLGQWVSFQVNGGSSQVGLLARDALARDAAVDPTGTGFRGVTFSYIVSSDGRVDEILAEAEKAGGSIVRPAQSSQWGGYFGYFTDPDGNLWKVVAASGENPSPAE
jgi:uncharacterized protein